jgi:hypothetical protein
MSSYLHTNVIHRAAIGIRVSCAQDTVMRITFPHTQAPSQKPLHHVPDPHHFHIPPHAHLHDW